jgi:hypothetical protein
LTYVIDGFLAGLGTALSAIIIGVLARATPWARRRVALWKQRGDTLDRMIEQFQATGGQSMYDRIARSERNIARIADAVGITIERPPEKDLEVTA